MAIVPHWFATRHRLVTHGPNEGSHAFVFIRDCSLAGPITGKNMVADLTRLSGVFQDKQHDQKDNLPLPSAQGTKRGSVLWL
jgi:hypothetical protein